MYLLPLFFLSLSKLLHFLRLLLQHSAQRNMPLTDIFHFWEKQEKAAERCSEAPDSCRLVDRFAHGILFRQTMLSGNWKINGGLLECGSECGAYFFRDGQAGAHQISYKPPVLRATAISSLPYLSSAAALNTDRQDQQGLSRLRSGGGQSACAQPHLIFSRSSMSLQVRRPSLSRWQMAS